MFEKTIQIVFGNFQVTVITDVVEIIERLNWIFSEMLESSTTATNLGTLYTHKIEEGYQLAGDVGIELEDGSLPDVIRCLQYSVVQLLIQASPNLIWLHAGAVAKGGAVLLLPGSRGQGKSGISTGLCQSGWQFLSDDISPLDPLTDKIIPFSLSPSAREFPGETKSEDWLRAYNKKDIELPKDNLVRQHLPLGKIIFPQFEFGATTQLDEISPALTALELFKNCWNFDDHKEQLINYISSLVNHVPAYKLVYGDREHAVKTLAITL